MGFRTQFQGRTTLTSACGLTSKQTNQPTQTKHTHTFLCLILQGKVPFQKFPFHPMVFLKKFHRAFILQHFSRMVLHTQLKLRRKTCLPTCNSGHMYERDCINNTQEKSCMTDSNSGQRRFRQFHPKSTVSTVLIMVEDTLKRIKPLYVPEIYIFPCYPLANCPSEDRSNYCTKDAITISICFVPSCISAEVNLKTRHEIFYAGA